MKHFTLFTFLYLVAGVCLTAIALGHPDITPNHKITLLINAGLLYLVAVLSTFRFWRQRLIHRQERLRDKPACDRNFFMILLSLIIGFTLFTAIPDLVNHNWAIEVIARVSVAPLLILTSTEQLLIRSQNR
ncbi:hypothetical protein [Nostoc sp. 'Peltigera malacea cyanobiont' DB3992]|uniref:hypothetical protein n=1 Tax=Nostoc sp. 'Peltigera malacea cyanobiont' DB3992 TaxID=1206980 RepID=UPI000C03C7F6|nr:hypothetical protein [Nostoc sp. 'Peltigera malacea cyanobiont' DB3992]PHM11272.1 hypothetical protein CK516_03570 [Nostoc sp. 'Peltigera malacea cyanobiont' DB3992]